jgi:hypothetical protein
MSEDTEIEVQIEAEEKPTADATAAAASETKKEASTDDVSEVIKAQAQEYETKLEAERKEKEAARLRAENAEREARAATAKVADSELDAVTNAIHAVEMERETVKSKLKSAMESGDFEGTVKAQEDLAQVINKLNSLKEGKTYIEQKKVEPQHQDPQEAYIARFTPRSQEYLRKHRDLITDTNKNKRMIAAHYEAEAEGLSPDSDAYFKFLDQKLGFSEAPQKQERQNRMPAAPISRGDGGDISSGGPAVIKLTSGEARAATDGSIVWNHGPNKGEPIGVKEYARRKSIMMKQGQYSEAMQ